MPTTMVLRFRDLTAPTIDEHRKLLSGKGYVWWGWWNKPNEKVPRDTFASFTERIARDGSMPIFLLDSGTEKLYRSQLSEIVPSPTTANVPSPDKSATPTYYHDSGCRAWFKFSGEILDASPDNLREYSYDEVPEFSDGSESTLYQDKRVCGIPEMLERRHKTIWFLQPYKQEHRDHAVSPPAPRIPANFVIDPMLATSHYIVQFSDLHFSPKNHAFGIGDDEIHRSLARVVIDDLQGLKRGVPPAVVILTGDFTWAGEGSEFEQALDFIQRLRSVYDLKPEQLVVIPGNHDIQWSPQEVDKYDPTKRVSRPSEEAEANYRSFYGKVTGVPPNSYLSMGRRYILDNYIAIDIIGLNSCRLEQRHFAGYGLVQRQQLEDAVSAMRWEAGGTPAHFRLIALHHHVVPVTPVEEVGDFNASYSITLDAEQVVFLALRHKVHLLVHGHQHHPFSASMTRSGAPGSLGIHGAGSAGVARQHIGPGGKNSYSIISFDPAGVDIEVRSTSGTVQGFDAEERIRFEKTETGGLRVVG